MLNIVEADRGREASAEDAETGEGHEVVDPAAKTLEREQRRYEGSNQHVGQLAAERRLISRLRTSSLLNTEKYNVSRG